MEWITFDKMKALIALCTFLAGMASYFGYDGFKASEDANDTRKQMTTVINHFYKDNCK